MSDLFDNKEDINIPLAHRIRPISLSEIIGQKHLLEKKQVLYKLIKNDSFSSLILCGEPGVGKTTIALIIKKMTQAKFITSSSLNATVKDIKGYIKEAEELKKLYSQETILFLDEFHRFSKSQQDSLLSAIERGIIRFIGATTYNPSFAIIPAILSRSQVFLS